MTASKMMSNHAEEGKGGPASAQAIEELKKVESNILVAVRLRPLISKEILEG